MEKINRFLDQNSKYKRLSKPLEAARVCDTARLLANDRFVVVSFREGLLTVGCTHSGQAANLQLEKNQLVNEINQKLGVELVKNIRFKMI